MTKPLRVLIVEDSEDDTLLLLRELRRGGYEPVSERIETPESMKAVLEKSRWDIIISDYVLPRFSGLAALDILKESGQDLPFIIVSGNIGEDIAVGAMRAGAHDYIIKGNLSRFVPAVERELREAEVRRERSRADRLIKTTNELLKLFPGKYSRKEYLDAVVKIIHEWSNCRCVGIRILNEQGEIPYESYMGFGHEFWESENWLSVKKDHCVCIRIISGQTESQDVPAMTEAGSFRCDNTFSFFDGLPENEKTKFRGVCLQNGFTSLAVIPIRFHDKTLAAIHLADEREGMVPVGHIEALEPMTPLIGEAIHRFNIEDELHKNYITLQETNELLEQMFSNINILIAYMDTEFNFIRVNQTYAAADGREPDFYAGKNHFDLFPHKENEEIFRNVVKTGNPHAAYEKPFEYAGHPERGVTYWDWTLMPVKNPEGKVHGLLLSLFNVTDRKLAEAEAIRAGQLAALGELAAGVAHEINNPVNGIINYAQILLNKCDTESKEYDVASRIIKESNRIATIVKNLLSFARDRKEEKKPVHINKIMTETLALTETQLRKDGIILKVNIPQDLPEISAHSQQIQQVFLNLLSNARYALNQKYQGAHNDKILEILGEKVTIDNNPYVHITFHDRGTGISSDILDQVMNPFFSTKPDNAGTGLGLSISHGIISDHGGKIVINSVEGEFTKVLIDLPAAK